MLKPVYRELLGKLIRETLFSSSGIDALNFRAANEDYLSELDELEDTPYIEKIDHKYYRLTLLSLSEFEREDQRIESIMYRCSHLFSVLRKLYKESPGGQINLEQFIKDVDLSEKQVRWGLFYLKKAPIWSSYPSDILSSEHITFATSESILKYKTLKELISQLREWAQKPTFGDTQVFNQKPKRPLFLKEIEKANSKQSITIPPWHQSLKPDIKSLMEEVYFGFQKEMRALPSMGLRAVIDVVCNDLIGDIGGFAQKLSQLEKEKHITPKHKALLETALDVGHATIHRGHFPELKDLRIALDIIEHLLKEVYILTSQSKDLKKATPVRKLSKLQ